MPFDLTAWAILIGSGVLIGIVVAAPIGPVNLICIRRTLQYGPLNGFMSGLGAALGDGVFAVIAAFGMTALIRQIEGQSVTLQVVGGLMLIAFGAYTFMAQPRTTLPDTVDRDGVGTFFRRRGSKRGIAAAAASTFALTITNPATMLGFAAMFAGLGSILRGEAPDAISYAKAGFLVAAVVFGSALWWFIVTTVTGLLHHRIDNMTMKRINQVSGMLIGVFGAAVLGHLVWELT